MFLPGSMMYTTHKVDDKRIFDSVFKIENINSKHKNRYEHLDITFHGVYYDENKFHTEIVCQDECYIVNFNENASFSLSSEICDKCDSKTWKSVEDIVEGKLKNYIQEKKSLLRTLVGEFSIRVNVESLSYSRHEFAIKFKCEVNEKPFDGVVVCVCDRSLDFSSTSHIKVKEHTVNVDFNSFEDIGVNYENFDLGFGHKNQDVIKLFESQHITYVKKRIVDKIRGWTSKNGDFFRATYFEQMLIYNFDRILPFERIEELHKLHVVNKVLEENAKVHEKFFTQAHCVRTSET